MSALVGPGPCVQCGVVRAWRTRGLCASHYRAVLRQELMAPAAPARPAARRCEAPNCRRYILSTAPTFQTLCRGCALGWAQATARREGFRPPTRTSGAHLHGETI